MSESQFEKLLKTLGKAKEEIDRLREDNEVLRGESQRLRWESKRLRGLLKTSRKFLYHYCISDELIKRIDKEIGDESE